MIATDGDCQFFPLRIKVDCTVYSPVVAVCITRPCAQIFHFLSKLSTFFIWISGQTAFISVYIIKHVVFMTETESVYCAVRTQSFNIIRVILSL